MRTTASRRNRCSTIPICTDKIIYRGCFAPNINDHQFLTYFVIWSDADKMWGCHYLRISHIDMFSWSSGLINPAPNLIPPHSHFVRIIHQSVPLIQTNPNSAMDMILCQDHICWYVKYGRDNCIIVNLKHVCFEICLCNKYFSFNCYINYI